MIDKILDFFKVKTEGNPFISKDSFCEFKEKKEVKEAKNVKIAGERHYNVFCSGIMVKNDYDFTTGVVPFRVYK